MGTVESSTELATKSVAEPMIARLPERSRVVIDEDSAERFACHFSHRWSDIWSLAVFAVCYNAFIVFVIVMRLTGGFVNAQGPLNGDEFANFTLLALSGIVLACYWAWLRYRRIDFQLSPESARVTRTFLGHTNSESTTFDIETTADVRRVRTEDTSIDCVEIDGADGLVEFGRELNEAENRFLLQRIQSLAGLPDSKTRRRRLADAIDEPLELPRHSQLQLLEDSVRRLEIRLTPPGRHERSLRYIAMIGNASMLLLSLWGVPAFLKEAPDRLMTVVFFSVFGGVWLMFVVLAVAWLIQRFASYTVHVQPGYCLFKRTLLGRETTQETRIDSTCTAELVIWAGKNHDAGYAVQVAGLDRYFRFGEMLSERDKRYLVSKLRFVLRERQ